MADTVAGTMTAGTIAGTVIAIAGHSGKSIVKQAWQGHQRLVQPIVSETDAD